MGRPKIKEENKKLKFGISLDPKLYQQIKKDALNITSTHQRRSKEGIDTAHFRQLKLWKE
jgi:hypothetical protein